jgi:hypothetical protein
VLCLACIPYLVSVQMSGDRDYLYRLGPTEEFCLKTETESSLRKVVVFKQKSGGVLDKNRTMDNVQIHNICKTFVFSRISPTENIFFLIKLF